MIDAHLNALGYARPFSAELDLLIVSGLCSGLKAQGVADTIEIPKADVIARWQALNTEIGDVEHQTKLIRVLRHRAPIGEAAG